MHHLKQTLDTYLNQRDLTLGSNVIGWGEACLAELEASTDSAVQHFAQGLQAWLEKDYTMAAMAWRFCQQGGLHGPVLDNLIGQATALESRIAIYTDGSFSTATHTGGAACVYHSQDHIGLLARYLPGPLPGNHYTEAAALHLALTAPELASQALVIYTDSATILGALEAATPFRLAADTLALLRQVRQLCVERNVEVHYLRSRTGHLLQARADSLAKWVCSLGNWPPPPSSGAKYA